MKAETKRVKRVGWVIIFNKEDYWHFVKDADRELLNMRLDKMKRVFDHPEKLEIVPLYVEVPDEE